MLAEMAAPGGHRGTRGAAAFGHTCVVPLLSAFRKAFPRLELELILSDTNLDLVADRIDLAIRLAPSYRADVTGVKLMPTRYRVVASSAYLAREGTPKRPNDLGEHDCLRFTLPDYRSRWLFRRDDTVTEVPVRGRLLVSNALALRSAVLDGIGPALLGDWLINDDLAAGNLTDLFPDFEVAATSFDTAAWLLYPSRGYLPRRVRVAIDWFRSELPQSNGCVSNQAAVRRAAKSTPLDRL